MIGPLANIFSIYNFKLTWFAINHCHGVPALTTRTFRLTYSFLCCRPRELISKFHWLLELKIPTVQLIHASWLRVWAPDLYDR
jgi:hypothetical protein